jgi:hypothetical protein
MAALRIVLDSATADGWALLRDPADAMPHSGNSRIGSESPGDEWPFCGGEISLTAFK